MNDLPAEDDVAPMVLIICPFMLYSLLKRKLSIPEWDSMLILSFVFLHLSISLIPVTIHWVETHKSSAMCQAFRKK